MSMQITIFEHSKTEKRCSGCKELKPLSNFCKNKNRNGGLHYYCKECIKVNRENNKEALAQRHKVYYENNKATLGQWQKVYYENNKEKIAERRKVIYENNKEFYTQRNKVYYENNKKNIANRSLIYRNQKLKSDPLFRLIHNLRSRVRQLCKSVGLQKNWRTIDAMGCTREEFIAYFESKFTDGMTWGNYGKWHVDHIKPISLATTEQEAIELSHYTNLQPLWAADNLSKGNKYD
jgi:hypothetical protein